MKNMQLALLLSIIILCVSIGFVVRGQRQAENPSKNDDMAALIESHDIEKALEENDVVPVAVIGSGPAGLSAALWTARAKYKTILFSGPKPGGLLTEVREIENWPGRPKTSGIKVIDDLKGQAEHFGAQVVNDTVKKVDFSTWPFTLETEKGTKIKALSVIIATGAAPKRLEVPGVNKYWGNGVGTCSICDAPFTKNKRVIVVGGGDTAGDRALQFAAYAKKVYMVVREPELEACGTVKEYLQENPKIGFLFDTEIEEIIGDGKKVTGINLFNKKTDERKKVSIDGVYFAIGYTPNSGIFKEFVAIDPKGFIVCKDVNQRTSVQGIFVAGDVDTNPHRKAAIAAGNGVEAALSTMDFLQEIGVSPDVAKKLKYPSIVVPDEADIQSVKTMAQLRSILSKSSGFVLVDFYADYCSLCRALLPELNELAAKYEDTLKIVKIERAEAADDLLSYFGITSVPYYIMFYNGRERSRAANIATQKDLSEFVASFYTQNAETEAQAPMTQTSTQAPTAAMVTPTQATTLQASTTQVSPAQVPQVPAPTEQVTPKV